MARIIAHAIEQEKLLLNDKNLQQALITVYPDLTTAQIKSAAANVAWNVSVEKTESILRNRYSVEFVKATISMDQIDVEAGLRNSVRPVNEDGYRLNVKEVGTMVNSFTNFAHTLDAVLLWRPDSEHPYEPLDGLKRIMSARAMNVLNVAAYVIECSATVARKIRRLINRYEGSMQSSPQTLLVAVSEAFELSQLQGSYPSDVQFNELAAYHELSSRCLQAKYDNHVLLHKLLTAKSSGGCGIIDPTHKLHNDAILAELLQLPDVDSQVDAAHAVIDDKLTAQQVANLVVAAAKTKTAFRHALAFEINLNSDLPTYHKTVGQKIAHHLRALVKLLKELTDSGIRIEDVYPKSPLRSQINGLFCDLMLYATKFGFSKLQNTRRKSQAKAKATGNTFIGLHY